MNRGLYPHRLLCTAVCALSLLTGCFGATAQRSRSEAQRRAETLLLRGIRAEQKGDTKSADALLKESLAVSTTIEDNQAKSIALINLARLHRLGHDINTASVNIDAALQLIGSDSVIYSEAAHEKSLIELMNNSAEDALHWAEKSVAMEKGNLLGRRLNLLGRIQLARNDSKTAAITLQKALKENRSSDNAEEEANSIRMLGIIARNENMITDAERLLSESLEIDKKIGVSTKIALDLEELGKTALAAGSPGNAVNYLERAYNVHLNADRIREAVLNQEKLAEIFTRQGDAAKADSALKTALKLATKVKLQQSSSPPDTIKPSNSP